MIAASTVVCRVVETVPTEVAIVVCVLAGLIAALIMRWAWNR